MLRPAFSSLVVPDALLDQIGPALVGQSSLFLAGNSKSVAEDRLRVYQDPKLIPYAVEVDGQIISVFDLAVHRWAGDEYPKRDPRWILCGRPCASSWSKN